MVVVVPLRRFSALLLICPGGRVALFCIDLLLCWLLLAAAGACCSLWWLLVLLLLVPLVGVVVGCVVALVVPIVHCIASALYF